MSRERVVTSVKQIFLDRAAELLEEQARFLREGELDSSKYQSIEPEIGKARLFKDNWDRFCGDLEAAGIDLEEVLPVLARAILQQNESIPEPQVETQSMEEPEPVQLPRPEPRRYGRPSGIYIIDAKEHIIARLRQTSEQNPAPASEIARPIWPDEPDLKKLRSRLFSYWGKVKEELASEGFLLVNITTPSERAKGQEGRYYLAKKEVEPIATVQEPVVVEKPTQKSAEVVDAVEPQTKQLTRAETYILAKALSNVGLLGQIKAKVNWEDIRRIRSWLTQNGEGTVTPVDAQQLFNKIRDFPVSEAKTDEVLNANKDNDWVGQLLVVLLNSGINSEEDLKGLLLPS